MVLLERQNILTTSLRNFSLPIRTVDPVTLTNHSHNATSTPDVPLRTRAGPRLFYFRRSVIDLPQNIENPNRDYHLVTYFYLLPLR